MTYERVMLVVWQGLRGAVWATLIAWTINVAIAHEGRMARAESAPHQLVGLSMSLLDVIIAYVLARAADGLLRLPHEALAARTARGEP